MITLIADVASTYVNIRTLEERVRVANTEHGDAEGKSAHRLRTV